MQFFNNIYFYFSVKISWILIFYLQSEFIELLIFFIKHKMKNLIILITINLTKYKKGDDYSE